MTNEKIQEIEAEIAKTQKNKATSGHLAVLKSRIAKLKRVSTKQSKVGGEGFDVQKTGIARVGLIGHPSVGKSTLLSQLTSTFSKAAEHEFTTISAIPGVLSIKGADIQIVDLPGILPGATAGRGRGLRVLAVARGCDLLLVVLSADQPFCAKTSVDAELKACGIRNGPKPPIEILKCPNGISIINSNFIMEKTNDSNYQRCSQKNKFSASGCRDSSGFKDSVFHGTGFVNKPIPEEDVRAILKELRINNVEIRIRGPCTLDDIIDVYDGCVYTKIIYLINKIDKVSYEELCIIGKLPKSICISAEKQWNLDGLKEGIWEELNLKRIFTKPKGQNIDYTAPIVLTNEPTVGDFCNAIHKTILNKFKYAMVWGQSAKHQPQKVGKDHKLQDCDVVQIIKKV